VASGDVDIGMTCDHTVVCLKIGKTDREITGYIEGAPRLSNCSSFFVARKS
jgi:hypothetical protein